MESLQSFEPADQKKKQSYLHAKTIDGKRAEIATKEYVDANKWNRGKGRINGTTEVVRSITEGWIIGK